MPNETLRLSAKKGVGGAYAGQFAKDISQLIVIVLCVVNIMWQKPDETVMIFAKVQAIFKNNAINDHCLALKH